jgi:ubiquinone/menaquinone biosynthesis C-methylase UbiE
VKGDFIMGILRAFIENHARPGGFLGLLAALHMTHDNRDANYWAVSLLDIKPTEHVIEVGFGPGLAIQKVAAIVSKGLVAGVDSSETMLKLAQKRNAAGIAAGRVELKKGDVSSLPYASESFDRVLAVNVIYFLADPITNLQELHRVTKLGGRVALFLEEKEKLAKMGALLDGVYTLYAAEQVVQLLNQAGFTRAWFETTVFNYGAGICVLGEK